MNLRQECGVMLQMIRYEGRNEVEAVVVALLAAQLERRTRFAAGRFQQLRLELLGEEFIRRALVDADGALVTPGRDQRARIVLSPGGLVLAQISRERFDAPRTLHGRGD